jgi:hypothetical protein
MSGFITAEKIDIAVAIASGVAALATLALATVTWLLARRTSKLAISAKDEAQASREANDISRESMDLVRASLSATIRPVLVDMSSHEQGTISTLRWADGSEDQVGPGHVVVRSTDQLVVCTVPLRNVGPGTAVITGLGLVEAPYPGSASRMIVPPGESTRFRFSIPRDRPELADGIQQILAGRFVMEVGYTDVDGQHLTISRAFVVRPDDPKEPYKVRQVALLRPGDDKPFAMSGPADG